VTCPIGYSPKTIALPFDKTNRQEANLRSPIRWLSSIKGPTFVFEGQNPSSNVKSLQALSRAAAPESPVKFFEVPNANHFSILAPLNRLIAEKVLHDIGPETNITFTEDELAYVVK
jgi:hypothetical protein